MDYLIDKKSWNLVIKKLRPDLALEVKQGLKKPAGKYEEASIKKELVLSFPDIPLINHGFFEEECCDTFGDYLVLTEEENCEIELAILEVLIETQGMSEKAKYKIFGNEPKFVIEQYEPTNSSEKGFVYLIRNDDIYKIGITDNLLRRFKQLKPDEVLNVVRCSNYENLEKELHKKFKKK